MAELPVDVAVLVERGSDPGATASAGKYYTKDVAGVTEWFYQASDGTVSQLAAGLVASPNSVEYQHLENITVKGPHTLTITNSLQSVFAPGNDTVSLAANTTYKVKGMYAFNNAQIFSTCSIGFSGGTIGVGSPGDASITLIAYISINPTVNTALASERGIFYLDGASANLWAVFPNVSSPYKVIKFEGMIKTVSAGTFVPQISWIGLGVTPTPDLMIQSYLELIPVGDASFDTVGQGGWA